MVTAASKTRTKAYSTSAISADKSMGEVNELLRKRRATGFQWTEEGLVCKLRFHWTAADETQLCARFIVEVKPPPAPQRGRRTSKQLDEAIQKERRRLFRVLVHYLKNLFEAVDGGLLSLEQALLPYLETGNGQTVAEVVMPRLRQLATGTLALGPGA